MRKKMIIQRLSKKMSDLPCALQRSGVVNWVNNQQKAANLRDAAPESVHVPWRGKRCTWPQADVLGSHKNVNPQFCCGCILAILKKQQNGVKSVQKWIAPDMTHEPGCLTYVVRRFAAWSKFIDKTVSMIRSARTQKQLNKLGSRNVRRKLAPWNNRSYCLEIR